MPARKPGGVDDVVAAEAVDDDASLASKPEIVTSAARPDTVTTPLLLATRDHVVAVGRVDDDRIGLAVAAAASVAARSMLTLLTPVPVRSLTVMLSAPPSALKSIVSTPSRSIVMLATSREQPCPRAIGRDVDVLVDVRAVEQQRVDAGLAFDRVAAVAGVPDERVVAGAREAVSLPRPPMTRSLPWLPLMMSLPSPPLIVSLIWPAASAGGVDRCRRRRAR